MELLNYELSQVTELFQEYQQSEAINILSNYGLLWHSQRRITHKTLIVDELNGF